MWKTLRILCLSLVVMLMACEKQSEVTVAIAHPTTTTTLFVDHPPPTRPPTTTTTLAKRRTTTSLESTYRAASSSISNDIWDELARCETPPNGDWGYRGTYEGGLQFTPSTWTAYVATGKPYALEGYPAHAYEATREQQIVVAIRVRDGVKGSSSPFLNAQGWNAWPTCRYVVGV